MASVGAAGAPSAGIITLIIVLQAVGLGEHVPRVVDYPIGIGKS